jgi:peroxiredoxin
MELENKPRANRLREMEQRFGALEPMMPEGPEKESLSVLHGMVLEVWRALRSGSDGPSGEVTLQEVADLHRTAPPMDGEARSEPLPVGSAAPDLRLPDASGQMVALSDFRGQPVVLAFYPLDWSPTCSDQLGLYQAETEEFARYRAQVVGISVDSMYSHRAWAMVRDLGFPLLADFEPKGEVARRYHVWREGDGFSERALYVVDPEGVIRYAHVSPRLGHVPDVDELFSVLDEIRAAARPPSPVGG